jgi:hypothetical protein
VASDSGRRFDPEEYLSALQAAAQRIIPNRRRMSLEDAEDIVGIEFERVAVPLSRASQELHARWFHRSPWWAILHPWQAHREGVRWGARWSTDDGSLPNFPPVEDLANLEAWRLTGCGDGPLSAGLVPAACRRISRTEYLCVAQVRGPERQPTHAVEVRIFCRRRAAPQVVDAVLKQF